uniref:Uncharacterized protein n=1 Tax=Balaenoptera musculus TaxID=9771 RepID=A0A8C0D9D6_BALMU
MDAGSNFIHVQVYQINLISPLKVLAFNSGASSAEHEHSTGKKPSGARLLLPPHFKSDNRLIYNQRRASFDALIAAAGTLLSFTTPGAPLCYMWPPSFLTTTAKRT